MATGYSTNLELALPVQGELSGTWGDTVNNGITQYLDAAIAGSQIISGSQTAVTLSNTNGDAAATNIAQAGSGATGTAQYQIIRCTGNPAGLLTITVSDTGTAGYSKTFVIINATSTSQSVKIVGSGPTTGITVSSGSKSLVAWNGTDFVEIASSNADGVTTFSAGTTGFTPNTATSGAITLAGTLATTNGGTGVSNNAASTITISGNFASNFTVSGAYTYTFPGQTSTLGYLNIPQSGSAKTTSYALATTDIGKVIEVGTGGSITVPNSTFAAGDAIIIFNNTSGAITMTMTITNAYIAGTDADKATISVATRGVANILFVTGTTCVVTGNVS